MMWVSDKRLSGRRLLKPTSVSRLLMVSLDGTGCLEGGYLPTTEKNDWCKIRAHYEQPSEFESGRIIGLKYAEEKFRPYTAGVSMNCLTACKIFPWPARSPDLSSIVHVWDMLGRRLHLIGNVDDLAQ
ncbi:transposable element Tc1 transposase [Trichonephila clavipes]|nr:transposable element Tc1 transposase [Trichonephila clavipes]